MTTHRKPIVVGVDGSAQALRAARWAGREAALRKRNLHLVHTYSCRVSGYSDAAVIEHQLRAAMILRADKCLEDAERIATEAAPGVTMTKQVVEGDPERTLRGLGRDADLLIVGSRGLGGFTGLLIGSTAVGLAARAACPVVVVRADREPGTGPVVIGVDATPLSDPAIAFAFEEASLRGSPLVAVHAWSENATGMSAHPSPAAKHSTVTAALAEEVVAERLSGWRQKYPRVRVNTEVRGISAADALTRLSKTAQLVVVGSRGRGGFTGLALGSTSQAVLRHADCPVAVVRADTR